MSAEALAIALVLAAAGLWMARPASGRWPALRMAAVGIAAAAVALAADRVPRTPEETQITNRPIQVREDGYVSSSACRACHPANYASWHASWHRTMTQVADRSAVLGDFGGIEVEAYGESYRLERQGDAFWVEMPDPEHVGGGKAPRVRRRILLTTGSHHEQDYWYETGHTRKLGFLPLTWLVEEARWIPFGAAFLMPPEVRSPSPAQLDRWESACIKCHATHGKPRTDPADPTRMDTNVAEFGIACEACHGPGEEHVRANRSPLRRLRSRVTDSADPTIVNPARLAPDRAAQVCGQCHGIHKPLALMPRDWHTEDDWRDQGLTYRPGDDLEASRYVVRVARLGERRLEEIRLFDPHFLEDRFWADGMVRVSGREYNGLIESPCFARGAGERQLTCLSCHVMHPDRDDPRPLAVWADDQLGPGLDGDRACLGCHPRFADGASLVAHTHHQADSTGSRCANCHMPYTTWGLVKAIRSHTISNPSVRESRDAGRPNACNACHLDRTAAWTGRWLAAWWGVEAVPLPPVIERVPLALVWGLGGDAGQRALVAWALGWEAAREVSNAANGWTARLLAQLLLDPYDAVRIAAARSLLRQPGFADFEVDPLASAEARREAAARVVARRSVNLGLLIEDPDRTLPPDVLDRIYAQRNDRRIWLRE